MKGKFKKFIATLLAAVTCLTMGACAGNDVVNPDNPDIPGIDDEQIDSSKTQLYVFNFYGTAPTGSRRRRKSTKTCIKTTFTRKAKRAFRFT